MLSMQGDCEGMMKYLCLAYEEEKKLKAHFPGPEKPE